jgi:hypothetical protein
MSGYGWEGRYQLTELNGGASPSDTGVRVCVGVSVGWFGSIIVS